MIKTVATPVSENFPPAIGIVYRCPNDRENLEPIFSATDVLWCWRCLNVFQEREQREGKISIAMVTRETDARRKRLEESRLRVPDQDTYVWRAGKIVAVAR